MIEANSATVKYRKRELQECLRRLQQAGAFDNVDIDFTFNFHLAQHATLAF